MAMEEYIQIHFNVNTKELSEILIAVLADKGFVGFEENGNSLKAYIPGTMYKADVVTTLSAQFKIAYTEKIIEPKNWNELWESEFKPVLIPGFALIRTSFHQPDEAIPYDIIINPKMSFGTGHHATTWLMMEEMRNTDIKRKSVLDFGTGTGILAILAEKMNASEITAIDHDEWSILNAGENIGLNSCNKIKLIRQSDPRVDGSFDIVLANINKNIILENLDILRQKTVDKGIIILSGLLEDDKNDIIMAAEKTGMSLQNQIVRTGWLCLRFKVC